MKLAVIPFAALVAATLPAQAPACVRADGVPWWQVGAMRFFQSSGAGERATSLAIERHFVDRRTLQRTPTGYRLDIRRTKLGFRDSTVAIAVEYGATGAVARISGDSADLAHDVAQLIVIPCGDLRAGRSIPDLGGRADTIRTAVQRSLTRSVPARPIQIGAAIDTLGRSLLTVTAQRTVTDTMHGAMIRQVPNQRPDTVHPWTLLRGTETERQLVTAADGRVVFRERRRVMSGKGWMPPHPDRDTVPVRAEYVSMERLVDSAAAALVLGLPRRGDQMASATFRDSLAMHYREWRGDTLIVRQFRRSGWRDELRTVWRDSVLVSAELLEPGTAIQAPGPIRRRFRVERGYLHDAGSVDSVVATPTHPWGIALDGFEDVLVPALVAIPADSQPHRFSMYGLSADRGTWLNWTVVVLKRGNVRVARFSTLQRQWTGSFIFTPTGELLFANLGGQRGVTRVPMTGTRWAIVLDSLRGIVTRADLIPETPVPAAPIPRP